MRKAEQVKAVLRQMLQNDPVLSGTVTSVSESKRTCTVQLDNGIKVYNVMLNAVKEAAKGITVIPVNKTNVQMIAISDTDFLIISIEEPKKVLWDIDGVTLEVKKDLFEINGGENGGLVMIKELKENLDALKKFVMKIHSSLPSAFSAVGASTAANGANGATSYNGAMAGQAINFKDMENKKVKH